MILPTHKISVDTQRAFVAAPMSGLSSDAEYKNSRDTVMSIVKKLKQSGFSDVYYAGAEIESTSDFSDSTLAINHDLGALEDATLFVLYYPEKIASSVLIEAGFALAKRIPMLILARDVNDLPYFFRKAEDASGTELVPYIEVYEYKDDAHILDIVGRYLAFDNENVLVNAA